MFSTLFLLIFRVLAGMKPQDLLYFKLPLFHQWNFTYDTSHYSFSFFAYWPAWSHKTFYISNCRYFTNGISHMTLHIILSHFSRTGRHEATRPFIFQIAAISPMEFHIWHFTLFLLIFRVLAGMKPQDLLYFKLPLFHQWNFTYDTSHYSFSFFAYWPAWSHKTFYISNCRYFTNGISHIRHFTYIKIESRKQFWPRSGPINRRVWSGSDLLVSLVVIFILIRLNNFLPTSVACWWHSPTDWTQIRLDTMLGLIWFQTVWHSDCNIRH